MHQQFSKVMSLLPVPPCARNRGSKSDKDRNGISEIFQLLWSEAAKQSTYVRREWKHALALHRPFFIPPVYWDKPMLSPPRELADIHFVAYLELQSNDL